MIPRLILNALRYLGRSPLRTVLILQGVIWGTALGVFPAAIIHGSVQKMERDASELGADRLILTFDQLDGAAILTWEDVAAMREEYAGEIEVLSAMAVIDPDRESEQGVAPNLPMRVLATDAEVFASRRMVPLAGRFFTADEVRAGAKVGIRVKGAGESPDGAAWKPGTRIDLGPGRDLEELGEAAAKSGPGSNLDEFGYDSDHAMGAAVEEIKRNLGVVVDRRISRMEQERHLIVPHTVFPERGPELIVIRAEPSRILALRDRVRADMIERGLQPILYINAMIPFLYGEGIDTMLELNRIVFIACVVVGTCIVCVMMVLSIVERQREIAIRRVEGARRWHVALQLVVETGTVCAVGGLLGVPLGLALAAFRVWLEPLATASWAFPPVESAVIVGVVTLIGLLSGLLPAWRAMRVDPVEILRYE